MTEKCSKADRIRIAKELIENYKKKLLGVVEKMPDGYDGRHIRAVFGELMDNENSAECVRRAASEMKVDGFWYKF